MAQIQSIEADIEKITPVYDRPRVQGGQGDRESAILRLLEAKRKCNIVIDEYADRKAEAIELINKLDGKKHREVLTCFYINSYAWESCAEALGYSLRQVYRLHREALAAISKIIPKDDI